ncbi:hypothetical protein GCM10027073_06500 [Streptomyces chlorus]
MGNGSVTPSPPIVSTSSGGSPNASKDTAGVTSDDTVTRGDVPSLESPEADGFAFMGHLPDLAPGTHRGPYRSVRTPA